MSVRRLADQNVQPDSFSFSAENEQWAHDTIAKYPEGRQQSAVIPLLMRAQEQDGWVTRPCIEHVAQMLGMPFIRVLEVATFYTQFQLKPVGAKAHIQVCGTTPCMLRGSQELIDVCKKKINSEQFKTNESGTLSWEEVECLGACVNAPIVMVFKDTYEDLTAERFEEIIDAFDADRDVKTGTQIDRQFSAPVGGAVTLTEIFGRRGNDVAAATGSGDDDSVSETDKRLFEAPAGAKDNLKLIAGVGPVLEKKLNGLGVTTFSQVAQLTAKQIAQLERQLKIKGRVERDGWQKHARALMKSAASRGSDKGQRS